jgi:sialate O-acetylesterase
MKIVSRSLPLVLLSLLGPSALAKVRLPAVISDHMVLQQEANVNLWGWAEPGEKITAKFGDKSVQTVAGPDKKWKVRLGTLKAGTTGDLTVTGEDTVTVKDVLVGEVWVASGQSNMEWIVKNSKDADQEIAQSKNPQIRMFTVTKANSLTPKEDCEGTWQVSAPETVGSFSAVGYFFARELQKKLNVPVGVIHTSWGGTPAEFWTPTAVLEREPAFKKYIERWEKQQADFPKAKEAYDAAMVKWKEAAEKAKAEGKPAPRAPGAPRGSDAFGAPGCLWNAMVEPLLGYTIQGAIWYQGESNANGDDAKLYRALFPTMILSWRQAWAQGGLAGADNPEFPFLFVQLANYMQRYDEPVGSDWAVLRESQLMTLELPRTGMAVTIDIGEANDIHPKNKQEVGRRLALAALAQVYYIDMEFSGPIYSGSQPEDGKIRLSFRNADGLKAADGGKIKGFAVAGEDKKFVWADVAIEGDHVLISSPQVANPVAVRYGWANNPDCNLVNSAGLPASPFRTDDWPQQLPPPVPK